MSKFTVPEAELDFSAIRSSGPGGQNVNKVATAIELRFDIQASSLPAAVKSRLLESPDRRISGEGIVVIKAQRFRRQEQNRADAIARLQALVDEAGEPPAPRIPTRPSRAAREKRLTDKKKTADKKSARGRIERE